MIVRARPHFELHRCFHPTLPRSPPPSPPSPSRACVRTCLSPSHRRHRRPPPHRLPRSGCFPPPPRPAFQRPSSSPSTRQYRPCTRGQRHAWSARAPPPPPHHPDPASSRRRAHTLQRRHQQPFHRGSGLPPRQRGSTRPALLSRAEGISTRRPRSWAPRPAHPVRDPGSLHLFCIVIPRCIFLSATPSPGQVVLHPGRVATPSISPLVSCSSSPGTSAPPTRTCTWVARNSHVARWTRASSTFDCPPPRSASPPRRRRHLLPLPAPHVVGSAPRSTAVPKHASRTTTRSLWQPNGNAPRLTNGTPLDTLLSPQRAGRRPSPAPPHGRGNTCGFGSPLPSLVCGSTRQRSSLQRTCSCSPPPPCCPSSSLCVYSFRFSREWRPTPPPPHRPLLHRPHPCSRSHRGTPLTGSTGGTRRPVPRDACSPSRKPRRSGGRLGKNGGRRSAAAPVGSAPRTSRVCPAGRRVAGTAAQLTTPPPRLG